MSLEEEYKYLLKYQPARIDNDNVTVFDISGYPHYENVISNWYAFFLNTDNPHGLGDLFYISLLELINKEQAGENKFYVEREYLTEKGNRIDIMVYKSMDSNIFYEQIIIENKIHAGLSNDLQDYWDSINTKTGDTKKGIVLCLHPIKEVDLLDFEMHTHKEYINIIKRNLSDYIVRADIKYLNLLQDFMINIEKMTSGETMSDDAKFYLKNAEKINKLLKIRADTNQTIIDNVYHAIQGKENWKWGQSKASEGTFSLSSGVNGAYYYITLDGLSFNIRLWMNDKLRDLWSKFDYSDKKEVEEKITRSGGTRQQCDKYHLADLKYHIEEGQIDSYHEEILRIISDYWESIFLDTKMKMAKSN